ncbi:MAG: AmmeMemoRadiSam system protein B [Bacteroidetes bacterium]|nr:AmmeMemoRadiSam system protein B [Bacteroidota bacterium]
MTAFCSSGNLGIPGNGKPKEKVDRQPYAAGRFYTADSSELRQELADLFRAAYPARCSQVVAIVSPHAGYVYSGEVAASAFNQIDPSKKFKHVFILASSHRQYFDGASIYNIGDYITPLGKVTVDTALANKLIGESKLFKFSPNFHDNEHSLEVQLPFLQYKLGNEIQIIPILIGTDGPETCIKLAAVLKPYLTPENLFVVSTDFSHYPSYADAVMVDKKTADGIAGNNPDQLLKVLRENEKAGIKELATSLCGYTSVLTLMYMTRDEPGIKVTEIQYKNSGDSDQGEKSRVVGYNALAFSGTLIQANKSNEFSLTEKDKADLLKVARVTLETYLKTGKEPEIDASHFSEALKTPMGAFVTLNKNHDLRGCIGRFSSEEPLYKVIQEMAISSATQDRRFSPVIFSELNKINIEISVLTPMKKIKSINEIILGKHGIYIKKGMYSGTFLPQVATETGWNLDEFLGHCARDKAGLDWDGWKDADIYTYEAIVFHESSRQ